TGVVGTAQRFIGADAGSAAPYTQPISVLLDGTSLLLPGVTRRYQATVSPLGNGDFAISSGTGRYNALVVPSDPAVPPVLYTNRVVELGSAHFLTVILPSPEAVYRLDGVLARSAGSPPTPIQALMEVQAFDAL